MKQPWEYAKHAREIAKRFKVRMIEDSGLPASQARAYPKVLQQHSPLLRELGDFVGIVVHAPIEDDTSYAVSMHEIGHCLSPTGSLPHDKQQFGERHRYTLLEEESAWEWAQHYAIDWTTGMQQVKDWALGTYGTRDEPMLDFADILEQMFGGGSPFPTGPSGPPPTPYTPPTPVDPNAGKGMAPTHARTASSIVDSIRRPK